MIKVKLKQDYLDSRGNRWTIREYYKEQLPPEIANDPTYVLEGEYLPQTQVLSSNFNNETGNIKFTIEKAKKSETSFISINLNTAPKKELIEIKGIADKTADNIIEKRPFKNLDDLKKKVNAKWESIDFTKIVL